MINNNNGHDKTLTHRHFLGTLVNWKDLDDDWPGAYHVNKQKATI